MIVLDQFGQVIRPALLWNDLRSAGAAADLISDHGGPGLVGRSHWQRADSVVHGHQAALAG
jgi:xylulokinase